MKKFLLSGILKGVVICGAFLLSISQYRYFNQGLKLDHSHTLLNFFKTDLQYEVNPRLKEIKKLTRACLTQAPADISEALLSLTETMAISPLTTFVLVRCFDESLADSLLSEEPYTSMDDTVLAEVIEQTP